MCFPSSGASCGCCLVCERPHRAGLRLRTISRREPLRPSATAACSRPSVRWRYNCAHVQETGNTPAEAPLIPSDTQPLRAVKKAPRLALNPSQHLGGDWRCSCSAPSAGTEAGSANEKRRNPAPSASSSMEQFQYALVDEQFGRYGVAKQRLEFIIQNGPSFPGAQNELAKVLVLMTIPTPTPTPLPTPTPDLRGEQSLVCHRPATDRGGRLAERPERAGSTPQSGPEFQYVASGRHVLFCPAQLRRVPDSKAGQSRRRHLRTDAGRALCTPG